MLHGPVHVRLVAASLAGMGIVDTALHVQGLWRSERQAELSLATTRGGEVVGLYRHLKRGDVREHGLTGHILGDQLVFSVPFPEQGMIRCWTGRLVAEAEGVRLDTVTWTFGRRAVGSVDFGGTSAGSVECFHKVHRSPSRQLQGRAPPARTGSLDLPVRR